LKHQSSIHHICGWRKSDSRERASFAISTTSARRRSGQKKLRLHDLWPPLGHAGPATLILRPSTSYLDQILLH
ncbi:hypothetical protein KCU78_g78, partial [Aureobasidium melanogenum]